MALASLTEDGALLLCSALGHRVAFAARSLCGVEPAQSADVWIEARGEGAPEDPAPGERHLRLKASGRRLRVSGPVEVAVAGDFEVLPVPAYLRCWLQPKGLIGFCLQPEAPPRLLLDPERTADVLSS